MYAAVPGRVAPQTGSAGVAVSPGAMLLIFTPFAPGMGPWLAAWLMAPQATSAPTISKSAFSCFLSPPRATPTATAGVRPTNARAATCSAQVEALKDPEVQKAQEALRDATVTAMKQQDPQTTQLMEQLQQKQDEMKQMLEAAGQGQ